MMNNKEIYDTQIFQELLDLIEQAPDYGTISLQIFYHDGIINRIKTTKEESIQFNQS